MPIWAKYGSAFFNSPMYATRPSARRRRLSKRPKTSDDGWWMVQIIDRPFFAIFLMIFTRFSAMYASKPDVGSSQNIIDGFVNI